MKRIFFLISCLFSLLATAQDNIYYGYAPRNPQPSEVTAHGTGKNNFIEAAICLNPEADLVVRRLEGSQILGVRCYVRADYKQKTKRWSGIWAREGALTANATYKYENLTAGWNEVMFDTPITIGQSPIYVGYQVFELNNDESGYPVVSYSGASVNDGFYINMAQEGFQEMEDRGTLLIEAIIKPATDDFSAGAFAQASNWPRAMAPSSTFDCNLYVRSQSNEPINSIGLKTVADDGANVQHYTIEFDEPISPFDATLVPVTLRAPNTEGEAEVMKLSVVAINGEECPEGKVNSITLYVSEDAFERIPLVEEFTGLSCVNCPFMAYYLDKSLAKFGHDKHVYVAHHAGFQDDFLTKEVDRNLLYLFGSPATYNPAVMYDRRVLGTDVVPVISAKEASVDPYDAYIAEAMSYPAKANVVVGAHLEGNQVTVRVYGKIAKALLDGADKIHLSAYIVEDDIKPEGAYRQNGVSANVADGAPADMVERFRHNGIIRIDLCASPKGDKIQVDADGYFDVTYRVQTLDASWVTSNMRAVAFVHRYNEDLLGIRDNYVLNAGQTNIVGGYDSIDAITSHDAADAYYDLQGRALSRPTQSGLYITNGAKIFIR